MEKALQVILVLILSSTKFMTAPITALNIGFGYVQTLGLTTVGGILGVLFFYFLSSGIMRLWAKLTGKARRTDGAMKVKKKFTWKNKMIVRVKRDYGLIGLAALTPTVLSIPVGTFLAARYFHPKGKVLLYLSGSVVVWSVIISSVMLML